MAAASCRTRRASGVSLVEILIVVGIIALVMGLILGTMAKVYRVVKGWA